MRKLKVIALIPTFNHGIFLEDCLNRLVKLKPSFDKYIFFENNSKDGTLKVIQRFNHPKELIRMWFRNDAVKILGKHGNPYGAIGIARQYLLERARKLDPDYAIFIDDDIVILDKNFIHRITSRNQHIVGAPYLRPFPEGMYIASKWKRKGKKGIWFKSGCRGFQRTYVTSAGCMCLSRKVIQNREINFLPIIWAKEEDGKRASEDFGYCIRANKAGVKVHIDCTLRVGHYATADDYKPWMVVKNDKGEVTGYVEFDYRKKTFIKKVD